MQISDEDFAKIKNGQITSNRFDAVKDMDAEKMTAADFEDYSNLCKPELPGELRAELALGKLKNAERRSEQLNPVFVLAVIVIVTMLMVLWCLLVA